MSRTSSTAERIKQYMKERGMTQADLIEIVKPYSQDLGVKFNSAYLSQVLSGKFEPSQEKIYLLSAALKLDPAYLMGWEETESVPLNAIPLRTVPILGKIACGTPVEEAQEYSGDIPLPEGLHADFALLCSGDSMEPSIRSGDYVFIRKQPDVSNGQIAAVIIDGEATLKRVRHLKDGVALIADNPAYDMIIAQKCDIQISGLAVGFYHSFI